MASKQKIAAVVGVLCEAFNRKPTTATFTAYEISLADLPDELLDSAGNQALRTPGEYMPTPGRLRELALTGGKSYQARADISWHEFDKAVGHHGGDRSISFADGLINVTVRLLGGWIHCCEKSGDDYFVFLQKQFKETYLRLCQSGASEELRRPLVGRLEIENAGFPERILDQLNAYTGKPLAVATSQPVLLPPSESKLQIVAERAADAPRIEFMKAN